MANLASVVKCLDSTDVGPYFSLMCFKLALLHFTGTIMFFKGLFAVLDCYFLVFASKAGTLVKLISTFLIALQKSLSMSQKILLTFVLFNLVLISF